jgi:hypothetical protein
VGVPDSVDVGIRSRVLRTAGINRFERSQLDSIRSLQRGGSRQPKASSRLGQIRLEPV